MTEDHTETHLLFPLAVLSIAQLIGWGAVGFPAVAAPQMASDLSIGMPEVFAGTTLFYVVMGACSPALSRVVANLGARPVMIAGTAGSAAGLLLLSLAHSPAGYFLGWLIIGAAGSASLTMPAHILLNEIAGRKAGRAIATLMLVTGLSSTIFWPLTSFLQAEIGWRGACEVYALAMALVCLPLYVFGLPRRRIDALPSGVAAAPVAARSYDRTFVLIVAAIVFNAFITYGFSSVLIELLKGEGLSAAQALAFGSALGIIQIAARGVNFVADNKWDGVAIGIGSSAMLCLSLLILLTVQGSPVAVGVFLVLYGTSSGALAVARSTIPLVFYDKGEFAKALSQIALPLNWISAASPPVLIWLMSNYGNGAVLSLCLFCSLSAIVMLCLLRGRRPMDGAVAA
ncbi:putative MFS family arabinose efflux permease [Neorhizobium sp. 2083]|uniref:MFS transporter n=1 Tax=Neorhizobium sp. 2083 TaxID=2817762 RepID=UPI002862D4BF|nr:MFS transporter [Neorhizobium sp. 2083]MDR6821037.1 putative MFS family arabinose efflux permease [Neorhizobium sp. 2083]